MIRAVIFDLGGTLLEFNPDRLSWLEWERSGLENACSYLLTLGYPIVRERFVARFIDGLPELWEGAAQGRGNLRLGDVIHKTCAACGFAPTEAELDEAIAQYIAPLDARVVLYDDALDTLEKLRAWGLKIGLVSNTMWPAEYHRRELDRFGLAPYLDHTVFSAEVGVWKPQPGIYRLSLDALGVSPANAVFVGDMPEHDIVGAQRAGMRGIHKRHPAFTADGVRPDAVITFLAELPDLVERW